MFKNVYIQEYIKLYKKNKHVQAATQQKSGSTDADSTFTKKIRPATYKCWSAIQQVSS